MQDKGDGRRKGKIVSAVMGYRGHKQELGYRVRTKVQPDGHSADGTRIAYPNHFFQLTSHHAKKEHSGLRFECVSPRQTQSNFKKFLRMLKQRANIQSILRGNSQVEQKIQGIEKLFELNKDFEHDFGDQPSGRRNRKNRRDGLDESSGDSMPIPLIEQCTNTDVAFKKLNKMGLGLEQYDQERKKRAKLKQELAKCNLNVQKVKIQPVQNNKVEKEKHSSIPHRQKCCLAKMSMEELRACHQNVKPLINFSVVQPNKHKKLRQQIKKYVDKANRFYGMQLKQPTEIYLTEENKKTPEFIDLRPVGKLSLKTDPANSSCVPNNLLKLLNHQQKQHHKAPRCCTAKQCKVRNPTIQQLYERFL